MGYSLMVSGVYIAWFNNGVNLAIGLEGHMFAIKNDLQNTLIKRLKSSNVTSLKSPI